MSPSKVHMATMNVSLPDAMRAWVEDQVKGGEYANASDYIRDLIRHDQERQRALQTAIQEGFESGRSPRKVHEVMAEAKSRLRRG
jgi:antitoxin ParD1/3/4